MQSPRLTVTALVTICRIRVRMMCWNGGRWSGGARLNVLMECPWHFRFSNHCSSRVQIVCLAEGAAGRRLPVVHYIRRAVRIHVRCIRVATLQRHHVRVTTSGDVVVELGSVQIVFLDPWNRLSRVIVIGTHGSAHIMWSHQLSLLDLLFNHFQLCQLLLFLLLQLLLNVHSTADTALVLTGSVME